MTKADLIEEVSRAVQIPRREAQVLVETLQGARDPRSVTVRVRQQDPHRGGLTGAGIEDANGKRGLAARLSGIDDAEHKKPRADQPQAQKRHGNSCGLDQHFHFDPGAIDSIPAHGIVVKLTAVGDNRPMGSLYRRHRFPPEIISHAVWLYHRFTLSFRDVEDLLGASVIDCWRSNRNSRTCEDLRLNSGRPVLRSSGPRAMKSLSCANRDCPLAGNAAAGRVVRHGFYRTKWGRRRRYRCQACGKTFCTYTGTPIGDDDAKRRVVKRAVAAGINYFDTAPAYGAGKSEALGWLLPELDRRPFLCTKFTVDLNCFDDVSGQIEASLQASLQRLRRDSVDLLQLRSFLAPAPGARSITGSCSSERRRGRRPGPLA